MNMKKLCSFIAPKKLTFTIDRIDSPCYTVSVTGGVVMSKNSIANVNNQPKTSMATAVKDISATINAVISESENTQREEFNALADIVNNDAISQEDRMKALDMMRESMEYRQQRSMARQEITACLIQGVVEILIVGMLSASGIICLDRIYRKKAA